MRLSGSSFLKMRDELHDCIKGCNYLIFYHTLVLDNQKRTVYMVHRFQGYYSIVM